MAIECPEIGRESLHFLFYFCLVLDLHVGETLTTWVGPAIASALF